MPLADEEIRDCANCLLLAERIAELEIDLHNAQLDRFEVLRADGIRRLHAWAEKNGEAHA